MFRHTMARIKRRPFFILAMVVFSAVLAAVLCSLNKNIEDEIAAYEEAYRTIPVTVRMCDLSGTTYDNLSSGAYAMNAFQSDFEMGQYLKDVQLKSVDKEATITIQGQRHGLDYLNGISSLEIDSQLFQSYGSVAWMEGYDDSVLLTNQSVCIVPEQYMPALQNGSAMAIIEIIRTHRNDITMSTSYEVVSRSMKIVGTHQIDDVVYIPFATSVSMNREFDVFSLLISAASAVVADNTQIDELKKEALDWFAVPNSTGTTTAWDYGRYKHYPTALEIDDSRLHAAAAAMENSIKINTLCSYVVLCLSAVAGFFVGFLAIRSRKREIMLMRSLGNSGVSIFAGCCAEQILCLIIGTVIGGAAFMWQPLEQIGLFMGIYFIGTILSLVIFISRNLLQGQKEDE